MPDTMRAEIRSQLFDVLIDFAKSGRPLPPIPGGQLLVDMLSTAAGTPVSADYVAMMQEDLRPTAIDPRGMVWRNKPDQAVLDAFHVLIIGAGVSGMCAAIRLQQAGIPFTIIEKNDTVSGTWYENSYPGCGVDTPNHFYSYSFEPNNDWSHFFAKREELWAVFRRRRRQTRPAPPHPFQHRSHHVPLRRSQPDLDRDSPKRRWHHVRACRQCRHVGGWHPQPAETARYPRPQQLCRPHRSHRPLGPRFRLARQAHRHDRHRRVRPSGRPDDRARCRSV